MTDCTIQDKASFYYKFRTLIYSKMHLYLAIVAPFCVLFVLNLLIIRKIMVSTKNSSSHLKPASKASNNPGSTSNANKKKGEKRTSLSVMLVAVCLWFMILKTPASVYLTFPATETQKVYFPLVYSIVMLVNYTNHSVNLVLYIACSSIFRKDFKEFFLDVKSYINSKFCASDIITNENTKVGKRDILAKSKAKQNDASPQELNDTDDETTHTLKHTNEPNCVTRL